MDLKRERDKALKAARGFAAAGNVVWAQLWLDRAGQFWPVTKGQLRSVQRHIPSRQPDLKGA